MDPEEMAPANAFETVFGRALVDTAYRDRLMTGNDEERIEALMEAGLSQAEAEAVLPELTEAASAMHDLAHHDIFGVKPYAA